MSIATPYLGNDKVNCEKHGWRDSVFFKEPGCITIQVCFTCFKEKVSDGLKNHFENKPLKREDKELFDN